MAKSKSNLSLVASVVSDLLGFQAQAAEQDAYARAQRVTAQGYGAEITTYEQGAAIARQNAQIEGLSADIQNIQAQRELSKSIGSTKASLAGAGFKNSVDQISADLRLGYLNQAITGMQASLSAGGYLEQAYADDQQAQAARMAAGSAGETASAYDAAAGMTRTNLTNATAALTKYLQDVDMSDPETQLITGTLKCDPNVSKLLDAAAGPNSLRPSTAQRFDEQQFGPGGRAAAMASRFGRSIGGTGAG